MNRIDRASKLVKGRASEVYQAFIDPSLIVRWLPPEGATAEIETFEPKPGGAIRMTLRFSDATGKTTEDSDVISGRFLELARNQRIVQEFAFASDDPAFGGSMTMRWSMLEKPEGTHVQVAAEDVPEGISAKDHKAGLRSSLDKLAALFT